MPKEKERVLSFCEEKFPEYEPHLTVDDGDVLIYYLRYKGELSNNFGVRDIVVYYNTWYAGNFHINYLVPELS